MYCKKLKAVEVSWEMPPLAQNKTGGNNLPYPMSSSDALGARLIGKSADVAWISFPSGNEHIKENKHIKATRNILPKSPYN